ncbi:Hypothetical predicted protein [Mytilus galloprovincialis]|uniref:HECT domain-containing protein n=1 Tax=Mytilus galloprovincialis TaxID=29158 RepID=A0A8B6EIR1_MYTGA|nr:Hypothetical predicted protein [Mytilus galloprovincialis]
MRNVVNMNETLQDDVSAVADFISPVPASVVTSSMLSVTEICDAIKEHKTNFISGDEENPLLMEVKREDVLKDTLGIIRFSQQGLHNPLRIYFVGELGVDLGGLRRDSGVCFYTNCLILCS